VTLVADRPAQATPVHRARENTTGPAVTPAQSDGGRPRRWRREGLVVGAAAASVYLAAAVLLDLVYNSLPSDAVSRMANGFYVLYSGDPHLAAIGFVWNPLTSLADIVPLLFKGWWPALASHDMAGSLVTVCAMTGTVHQLRASLYEWGVSRSHRLALTALFALSPMTIFYAANGMSEALYMFCLVATTRYVCRWVRHDDLKALVYGAIALSLGYLARNETIGAALLLSVVVFGVSRSRTQGPNRARLLGALTDVTIAVGPFATALAGWATASYVITKQPFRQFQTNAVIVHASGFTAGSLTTRLVHEITALEALAPIVPIALIAGAVFAWRRRDAQFLVPIAVLGGGLGFSLVSYFDGLLLPWLRFYILVIPLCFLVVGYLLSPPVKQTLPTRIDPARRTGIRATPSADVPADRARRPRAVVVGALGLVAIVAMAVSWPTSARAMLNPNIGTGYESQNLGFIFHRHLSAQDRAAKDAFAAVQAIDRYVTSLHLPNGSILVDNDVGCVPQILTSIPNDKVFVIPNDRDFQQVLADPLTFRTRYLLVSGGTRNLDSVRAAFPDLGMPGGVTKLTHVIAAQGECPTLSLYQVTGHPRPNA
jgi:hypothetical protein